MKVKKWFHASASISLFILMFFSLFMAQVASAEGDGTGGGTGDGKSQPVVLVSSSINNGATGVSLKPVIKLTFSKNIVNMSVIENNKKCFSMQTENGTKVPINLTLADDQIEFEKRNDAIITPIDNLAQGTTYSIVISSSLMSKSGVSTGKEIKINFTTEGAASGTSTGYPSKTTPIPETAAPKVETTTKTETFSPKAVDTPKTENNTNINTASKVDGQPTTDSETKTDDTTTAGEQSNEDITENETTVTDVAGESATPYESASTPVNKTAETQSNTSNALIYVSVITILVVIGSVGIYLYKKRKRKK